MAENTNQNPNTLQDPLGELVGMMRAINLRLELSEARERELRTEWAAHAQTSQNQITELQATIRGLHEQAATPREATAQNTAPTAPNPAQNPAPTAGGAQPTPADDETRTTIQDGPMKRPRARLPEIAKFDGERRHYRAWKLEAESKIQVDGEAIGDNRDQFRYIYSRLQSNAQDNIATFFELHRDYGTPDEFFTYLDSIYLDPNARSRALTTLRSMRQGDSESFAAFLPRFEKELHDSQRRSMSDEVAMDYLEGALNSRMQEALVTMGTFHDYRAFVQTLMTIGSRLDALKRGRPFVSSPRTPLPPSSKMDWEPAVKGARAAPSSGPPTDEDKDELRRQGRCFRCGGKGHRFRVCPSKPPGVQARKAKPAEEQEVEEEEAPESVESGNE